MTHHRSDRHAFLRISSRAAVVAFWVGFGVPAGVGAQEATPAPDPTHEGVRVRIELLRSVGRPLVDEPSVLAVSALPRFYEDRGFVPVWTDADGGPRVQALVRAIRRAEDHGLDPSAYHLEAIEALAATPPSEEASTNLEFLASDAFLVLGSHLLHGRVNPETINPEWLANRRNARIDTVLARAVETDRIEETLYDLAPRQARYRRLVEAARELRSVVAQGGWPTVPDERLEVGSTGPAVLALRRRLGIGGDVPSTEDAGRDGASSFDEGLRESVIRFQTRHGLDADGVVGPATLGALNVSAARRLRQLEINLERWRWLPETLGAEHIEVNIPGFEVRVVENGNTVSVHRAVVGRPFRQTPMFSGTMTYLVLSPYWHVPPTIAAVDKLPAIKKDPGVIARERMTLLEQGTDRPVDPATVDWAAMTGPEFNRRYRLRQEPGPNNALGDVKFMFPNKHNVYLHDTPTRDLFERSARDFSSGCIRIERPLELAAYLLRDRPGWNRQRIDQVVQARVEQTVRLERSVPVHLLYWTAWIGDDETPNFREDIYGRDDLVWNALTSAPPVQ